MAAKMKVVGTQELVMAMRELASDRTRMQVARRAIYGPAKDLRAEAQAQALAMRVMDSGATYRNIAIKRIRVEGKIGYTVGIRHGTKKQRADNDPWYWWFVEFGTVKQAARPFMRSAFARFRAKAAAEIIGRGRSEVLRAARSAMKRHAKQMARRV